MHAHNADGANTENGLILVCTPGGRYDRRQGFKMALKCASENCLSSEFAVEWESGATNDG